MASGPQKKPKNTKELWSQLKEKDEQLNELRQMLQKTHSKPISVELKLANCDTEKEEQMFAVNKIDENQMGTSDTNVFKTKTCFEKDDVVLSTKIEDVYTQLENANKENENWYKRCRDLNNRCSILNKDYKTACIELDKFRTKDKTSQETIKELSEERDKLAKKLTESQQRCSELEDLNQSELITLKSNETILTKQLSDLEVQLTQQTSEKSKLESELKISKEINLKLEDTISIQLSKIENLEHKFINFDSELKSELIIQDAQIREMQSNIDLMESNNEQLKKIFKDKYSDYDDLKSTIKVLTNDSRETYKNFREELENAQTKNMMQLNDLNILTNKVRWLESEKLCLEVKLSEQNIMIKSRRPEKASNVQHNQSETRFDNKGSIGLYSDISLSSNFYLNYERSTFNNTFIKPNVLNGK